ncbi:MAG: FHA domain-containing protein [Holophagales bacterium]|nr:FHA domain-containing protein [Holophagales bacterium]
MARPTAPADDAGPHRSVLTVEEDGVRHTFHLDGAATIGREPGCDVLLASPTVSRRHALVAPNGEGWIVRDLGSGNGTFLDARRVDEAPLPNGVAIRFGSVPAWFEEEPDAPLTSSQRIQRTLTQTLSIQPAKRTRKKACVACLAAGVALLLAASMWQRGCESRESGAVRPADSSRPAATAPAEG